MNGADVVINKLILQFGNQLRCNFQLLHNGEPVKYEYISWRIHLPIMERELVGKYRFVSFERYVFLAFLLNINHFLDRRLYYWSQGRSMSAIKKGIEL